MFRFPGCVMFKLPRSARPFRLALIALAAAVSLPAASGCRPLQFVVTIGASDGELDRRVVVEERGALRDVAIVDVTGMIVNAERGGPFDRGFNPVSRLHRQLKRCERDDDVAAVLLRINSPGGGVTASDAMYREVVRFRERSGKPVVAMLMDVAASGGYYLACAADEIVAYPTTVTGSVGVILQTVGVGPALARIGVQSEAITSGPNKDAGNLLGSLDEGERAVLQAMVDDFYARFARARAHPPHGDVRGGPRSDRRRPGRLGRAGAPPGAGRRDGGYLHRLRRGQGGRRARAGPAGALQPGAGAGAVALRPLRTGGGRRCGERGAAARAAR